jgi:hypothetical protein
MFDFYLMDIFILDSRITDFARSLCNINFDRYLQLEDNTVVSMFDYIIMYFKTLVIESIVFYFL